MPKTDFLKASTTVQLSSWNVWEISYQLVPCFDASVNGIAVTAAAAVLQNVIASDSAMEEQHPPRQRGRCRVTILP